MYNHVLTQPICSLTLQNPQTALGFEWLPAENGNNRLTPVRLEHFKNTFHLDSIDNEMVTHLQSFFLSAGVSSIQNSITTLQKKVTEIL